MGFSRFLLLQNKPLYYNRAPNYLNILSSEFLRANFCIKIRIFRNFIAKKHTKYVYTVK